VARTLPQSGSDISVEDGMVVWRLSLDTAEFYAVEMDRFSRNDAGVRDDQTALFAAVDKIKGDHEDE